MSDEIKPKDKTFEFPMMPIFGVDLGRELGSIDSRLNRMENDILEVKRDIKAVDAKLTAKIDAVEAKLEAKIDAVDAKLTAKIDAVDAKFEAKTDKMAYALNRLDERTKNLDSKISLSIGLTGAILAAVVAGIFLQYFAK